MNKNSTNLSQFQNRMLHPWTYQLKRHGVLFIPQNNLIEHLKLYRLKYSCYNLSFEYWSNDCLCLLLSVTLLCALTCLRCKWVVSLLRTATLLRALTCLRCKWVVSLLRTATLLPTLICPLRKWVVSLLRTRNSPAYSHQSAAQVGWKFVIGKPCLWRALWLLRTFICRFGKWLRKCTTCTDAFINGDNFLSVLLCYHVNRMNSQPGCTSSRFTLLLLSHYVLVDTLAISILRIQLCDYEHALCVKLLHYLGRSHAIRVYKKYSLNLSDICWVYCFNKLSNACNKCRLTYPSLYRQRVYCWYIVIIIILCVKLPIGFMNVIVNKSTCIYLFYSSEVCRFCVCWRWIFIVIFIIRLETFILLRSPNRVCVGS